jgi:hypothetical protein
VWRVSGIFLLIRGGEGVADVVSCDVIVNLR